MTASIAEPLEQMHIADLPAQLRAGQEKAIPALIDHFGENDRGILQMCCGSGKTVTGAIYAELRSDDLTVVFTPYIHLVKQWRDDYQRWCGTTKAKFMCVCSEKDPAYEIDPLTEAGLLKALPNTSAEEFAQLVADAEKTRGRENGETFVSTDPEEIAKFLKKRGRKVVFVCYPSSEAYGDAQRLAGVHAKFGIFDEAHVTASGDKSTFYSYALHDINVEIEQRLFMTATVRHYTRDGMAYSMDNEYAYGKHVLVDANGNPDPWTIRQAIDHNEAPPYRIVFSFVTDPSLNPKLVQLPPYQSLVHDIGDKADPGEVLRLTGQAMALERIKEKYGVKKPLGFFSNIATAQLYTDILNVCKNYPEYFPNLSQTETAVSVSGYDPINERRIKVRHLHNSPETEINNSKLFLFGTSEDTIDAVGFGDPMSSDTNVIQASGRAMRYLPGKIATIFVPIMLPYLEGDLTSFAEQLDKDQIRNAFRKTIDILDSLSEADPILRHQMLSGNGNGRDYGKPGIIEFDFPKGFIPDTRQAIAVEAWRVINPESDFIDKLYQDKAALDNFRLEKHLKQNDPIEETKAVKKRKEIKILPRRQAYGTEASRMRRLYQDTKLYFKSGEKEGRYGNFLLTTQRINKILHIYEWDKDFVLQDDFEKLLGQDIAALIEYRLRKHPKQSDPAKETEADALRSQIKRMPQIKGYEVIAQRMGTLRRDIRSYYNAEEKEGRYSSFFITANRVRQVFKIYGWDKQFIMQDDFEELLKQDAEALNKYRLEKFPHKQNAVEELEASQARSEIRVMPKRHPKYYASSRRINSLRQASREYYQAEEKEGRYIGFTITANRVRQIFEIYGWDKNFVLQDEFEKLLKQDAVTLQEYRLAQYPIQNNSVDEKQAATFRDQIKVLPEKHKLNSQASRRMNHLRRDIKAYYKTGEKEAKYTSYTINAARIRQVFEIYAWDKQFVMQDEFEEFLKQDVAALTQYKLKKHPRENNPEKETQVENLRSQIKIMPQKQGYQTTAYRMYNLRQDIKAYYEAGEKDDRYKYYVITATRVRQVFKIYGWDKDFAMQKPARYSKKYRALERMNQPHIALQVPIIPTMTSCSKRTDRCSKPKP